MNVLDIVLIILFIPAIIRGISKGFIEQFIALASLFLSAWLAYLFADKVGTWLSAYIDGVSKEVLYIFAFIIIIIPPSLFELLFSAPLFLLAKVLSKVVSAISLGWLNSILGLALAVFNTALIIGLILSAFSSFNASTFHLGTEWMDSSVIYRWISDLTQTIFPYIENLFNQISDGGAQMC